MPRAESVPSAPSARPFLSVCARAARSAPRFARILLGTLSLSALALHCQASPSAVADAGTDFKYQGEFAGQTAPAGAALGAQVVANGNGAFTAVFLPGGLPGAGWDTAAGRSQLTGSSQADSVLFPAVATAGYVASISPDGATLNGKTPQGGTFALKRITRKSPTLAAAPPADALVLFDGKDLSAFVKGSATLDSGLLLPQGSASSGAVTTRSFGSFTLHLEFLEPFMPEASGQGRGNSGVYLQGRYELQILDSFGLNIHRGNPGAETEECGAFYQLVGPRLNMSLPPLAWQTYDVEFTKARFDSAGKTQLQPARVTIRLNGVLIHENQELKNGTLLGDPVGPGDGPIRFQAHGDPVKFRNIWIVENAGTPILPGLRKTPRTGARTQAVERAARASASLDGRRLAGRTSSGVYFRKDPLDGTVSVSRAK
jgi:hypothetical protein